jgi:YNFM family putative membrane transporter
MAGFLIGAAGMLAVMYSTQAILPELAAEFQIPPSSAGLSVSIVVLFVAAGAWLWGPVSDRFGRKPTLVTASALLVLPTVACALAPSFPALLAFRALQGAIMPGLLAVGLPYVAEALVPRHGQRAMGYYVAALIAGGLLGRVGVALLAEAAGWRVGLGLVALLPAAGAVIMRRGLLDLPLPERSQHRWRRLGAQLCNPRLLRAAAVGSAFVFTFTGVFSYVTFRLQAPPFGYGTGASSAIFLLWLLGVFVPFAGRLAERIGWRRLARAALLVASGGLLISLPDSVVLLSLGLACVALANFAGVTAAQLGVSEATRVDRGVASAVYFSLYYTASSLGGYLPGLAWEAWRWAGVAALAWSALALAALALLARGATTRGRASGRRDASRR